MKNNIFKNLWVVYKDTLPLITSKRIPRIEQCIEEFEAMGYDLSTMSRAEAKEFGKLLGKKLSYTSAVAYSSIINKFLNLCEERTNTTYEHIYSNMIPIRCDLYLTEDEFLDDVYEQAKNLVADSKGARNLEDNTCTNLYKTYYNVICLLVLLWYGLTYEEISNLKIADIQTADKTISIRRNTKPYIIQLSNRAFEAVNNYKTLTSITYNYRNPVTFVLPDSGYLFRYARNKKNTNELYTPVAVTNLTAIKFKFCRNSNIKKQIELSGAFRTIEERITTPHKLCERVHYYLGDTPVSDSTIKTQWIVYLDELSHTEGQPL